jgi:hypothetical protein
LGIDSNEENLARFRAAREARGGSTTNADTTPGLRGRNEITVTQTGPEVSTDPLSYLQEALRPPAEGEKQIQGTLVRLECDAKGILFVIQVADRIIKLRSKNFENVQITAFTNDAGTEITCGPRKPANPVVVCYQPTSDLKAKHYGEMRSLEFVPKDFKLKS